MPMEVRRELVSMKNQNNLYFYYTIVEVVNIKSIH